METFCISKKMYLLNNLRKDMGVFFCYALLNRVPCHVISKLGNSNLALESYDPSILPNFEMTTKLSVI